MIVLIVFAFLAGIATILSPCILPVLPIILAGAVGEGKKRPLGIVIGFVLSFTIFTLFLAAIVRSLGVSPDLLRTISIVVIFLFGVSLLFSRVQANLEKLFSKVSSKVPVSKNSGGFAGGLIIGLSLGLLWTPCVGPIIASVITLAVTSSVDVGVFLITLAYSLGTAIPMLLIMLGGRALFQRLPWLLPNSGKIQKFFGLLLIMVAIMLFFNLDRKLQTSVLEKFPQYGVGLTSFENNTLVVDQLEILFNGGNQDAKGTKDLRTMQEEVLNPAPEIIPGGEWFNSKPLKLSDLKGKVVLIDFWTYTCINCIRTFPYLRAWDEKYRDKGLVIIGVHTPEFAFEKKPENLEKAIEDFGLKYPIVQDNDYATWQAYDNHYWPAKYFVDKNGKIRSWHFGEGEYDNSEKIIQELLAERGEDVSGIKISNEQYQIFTETRETYLGYERMEGLASPEPVVKDQVSQYSYPKVLPDNQFALKGSWEVGSERSRPASGSALIFNFGAKDVYLVMRTTDGKEGRVIADGKVIVVKEDKLYQLIKLNQPERQLLNVEFMTPNIEVYAFTFG